MENQTKTRIRKSPEQQILEAKEALRRAHQRQRTADTRTKIIIGALAQKWLAGNAQAARAFLSHLRSAELREHDQDILTDFMRELSHVASSAQHQVSA